MKIYDDPAQHLEGYISSSIYLVGLVCGERRVIAEYPLEHPMRDDDEVYGILFRLGEGAWRRIHYNNYIAYRLNRLFFHYLDSYPQLLQEDIDFTGFS